MRRVYFFLYLLIISILLPACGRQVDVVQTHQFKLMADRMPKELMARNIIDSSRDYMPSTWGSGSVAYGEILYRRLSPAFLFGDVVEKQTHNSFAEMVTSNQKENSVVMRTNGFGIVSIKKEKSTKGKRKTNTNIEQRVDVDMVAVTDWDGDEQNDWIISCKVLRTRGAIPRIYYIVVSNPNVVGTLRGGVVAVYDDLGAFGRLYMRESMVKTYAPVEDVVPGLKAVTMPPTTEAKTQNNIQERVLD